MRLLVTRPLADAEATAALLAERGIEYLIEPLIDIKPVPAPEFDLEGVQAILVTSANGVRAFAACEGRRDLRVLAVGDASARAALDLGFSEVEHADGDVESLADLVKKRIRPEAGALLHAAGSRLAGDLGGMLRAAGYDYRRVVLYESVKAERLNPKTRTALANGELDGVMLYSPRTAAAFAGLVRAAGLEKTCSRLIAFCLSMAVADRVESLHWKTLRVAARPEQAALLAEVDLERGGE